MNKEEIKQYIKTDDICKGIKVTNIDAVLTHIERILELFQYLVPSDRLFIRYYMMGYAAGVQSRAK